MKLKISDSLSLPTEAITETFAILAKRGVGKTYTASVLAEEMLKAHLPVVIADPTGAWWGLRSSANGKHAGLPITVLGGEHADVPLEATAGKMLADMIAEDSVSLVFDLSLFSKADMVRFMTDFCERIYHKNRNPLHLILDEADAFAPQKPRPEGMRLLGAVDDIVRRGRIRGIGVTLVTQRSAVLNKDVLTQCEVLIALRTPHPNDRKPIADWIEVHGTDTQHKEMMDSLASLPKGDAWVLSAGWLEIFKRIHIRTRETFNSSATPKPGEVRVVPKVLAEVDLEKLRKRMAETIERAKADDPRALRKKISELQAELSKKPEPKIIKEGPVKIQRVEVPIVGKRAISGITESAKEMRKALAKIKSIHDAWGDNLTLIGGKIDKLCQTLERVGSKNPSTPATYQYTVAKVNPIQYPKRNGSSPLPQGERSILIACAQHDEGCSREQLTILTGYKRSTRDAYIARLREKGLVTQLRGSYSDLLVATPEGKTYLGPDYHPLPTGDELYKFWLDKLPDGEKRILVIAHASFPKPVSRDEISELTGFKRSTRDAYISRLATRKIVRCGSDGLVEASDKLFN